MKITFLGGADEVGASSILIEIGGKRLLVDAGIRPSPTPARRAPRVTSATPSTWRATNSLT